MASLQNDHVDLVRLDLRRLGKVAKLVAQAVRSGNHKRLTKKRVVEIVVQVVKDRLVAVEDLEPKVQEEVRRVLEG